MTLGDLFDLFGGVALLLAALWLFLRLRRSAHPNARHKSWTYHRLLDTAARLVAKKIELGHLSNGDWGDAGRAIVDAQTYASVELKCAIAVLFTALTEKEVTPEELTSHLERLERAVGDDRKPSAVRLQRGRA